MCSKVTRRTLNSWLYSTLWFIINCNTYFRMMPFFCIHISQGSVATCLKCGGIFKHKFVANFLPSRIMKNFWKSDNILWSYGQESGVLFFLTHGVVVIKSATVLLSSISFAARSTCARGGGLSWPSSVKAETILRFTSMVRLRSKRAKPASSSLRYQR